MKTLPSPRVIMLPRYARSTICSLSITVMFLVFFFFISRLCSNSSLRYLVKGDTCTIITFLTLKTSDLSRACVLASLNIHWSVNFIIMKILQARLLIKRFFIFVNRPHFLKSILKERIKRLSNWFSSFYLKRDLHYS